MDRLLGWQLVPNPRRARSVGSSGGQSAGHRRKEGTVELRALVSAANASAAWDLRCEVREQLIAFLQREYPHALPRRRAEVLLRDAAAGAAARPVPLRPTGERVAAASRAP
jgi:hypothetical protein